MFLSPKAYGWFQPEGIKEGREPRVGAGSLPSAQAHREHAAVSGKVLHLLVTFLHFFFGTFRINRLTR